jgi:MFS transporter, putative metabolite:H+ symporter
MSVATVLSAFAQGVNQFVACQMASRMFMVTASATAFVIVTEEFDARHRGWGIGILGGLSAFGVGLSALLFAAIDALPYGWRAMYLVGVVPILVLPMLRSRVTETARFHAHRRSAGASSGLLGWARPLVSLARAYPGRSAGLAVLGAGQAAAIAASYNFSAFFVQSVHGWAPGQYSLMLLAAGGLGVIGHPFAGRLADSRGRRRVGSVMYGLFPPLALGFYGVPGWLLPFLWIPLVFALTGGMTIARALSTELFPTSYRGTASGWLQLVDTLGGAAGLFAVSWLTADGESAIPAVRIVAFASLFSAGALLLLPETGSRELEDISRDR